MDVIALTPREPDPATLLAGLYAGGPDTRVTHTGEGAVIQLRDEAGHPLLSVEAPILVQVPGEVERLLGTELPVPDGPVWWTEARASTAVAGAAGLAGSFAGRLATVLDGVVWPPGSATTEVITLAPDPANAPTPPDAPPAAEVLTDRAALVLQDRPVVPLSGWLADALQTTAAGGRALHLVTPATSRLTLAARSALRAHPGRWVVHDGDNRYYDGLSGTPLRWGEAAFVPAPDADTGPAQPPGADGERQLVLSLRAEHPATGELVLGGGLETAWRALTGAPPAGWGTSEPINVPWSPRQLTELARQRMPRPTWLLAVGRPGRPALATLEIARTRGGVGEDSTLTIGYGPGEEPPLDALPALAHTLVTQHRLGSLLVSLRAARRDLTVPAHPEPSPVPVSFTLGAEAVQDIGLHHASHPPHLAPGALLGPARRPGLYYALGDGTNPRAWAAFQHLAEHLRAGTARAN
ncbi:DUF6177 family protein [Streptomyces sp. 796.1]|uniref:DUF6177 family protein n=1 Tax=Streptomyces sp. 796.1 TaxID=3163029 RepID=UPI0039C8FA87